MNNSKIAEVYSVKREGEEFDRTPMLREMQTKNTKIIEAIERINATKDWQMLREELFDGAVETLERRLQSLANAKEVDTAELYRTQGQLVWAKKYANLEELQKIFKVELQNIKKKLKENG